MAGALGGMNFQSSRPPFTVTYSLAAAMKHVALSEYTSAGVPRLAAKLSSAKQQELAERDPTNSK